MKHVIDYTKKHDFLFGLVDVALWSETETFLGIVAGSMATMRPLLRYLPFRSTSTQPHTAHAQGTLSDQRRGIPLRSGASSHTTHGKSFSVDRGDYMGHSFQITSGTAPDVERGLGLWLGNESADGDGAETESQRHFLKLMETEITKETQYEVKSERVGDQDDSSESSERGIGCAL
jgi:hypothetical protein